jgi:hypothetical protein
MNQQSKQIWVPAFLLGTGVGIFISALVTVLAFLWRKKRKMFSNDAQLEGTQLNATPLLRVN